MENVLSFGDGYKVALPASSKFKLTVPADFIKASGNINRIKRPDT